MLDARSHALLLGFREDGRPIFTLAGGSEGAPEGGGEAGGGGGEGGESGGEGGDSLDGLRAAIENERGQTKAARDALRPWRALAQDLGVKSPSEIKNRLEALTGEQAKSAEERDRRDAEILTKANRRVVRSTIRALAAKDFADPSDAVLNLSPDDYEVDDSGELDEKRIKADLADLLKRKPHLGNTSKKVNFEGGARKTAGSPTNMDEIIRQSRRR